MLLLIVILTLYMIVPLAVLLLSRQTVPSQPGPQRAREDNPFSTFCIEQAFDPDHGIIWNTQLPALQLIGSCGQRGLRIDDLYPFYVTSCCHYPELYDGSSFEDWIGFLARNGLITVSSDRVFLRTEGRQFLNWRATRDYATVRRAEP